MTDFLTPLENARLAVAEDPELLRRRYRSHDASLRLLAAVRLCPTLTIARAYLAGETIPNSALDPHWRKAYGL